MTKKFLFLAAIFFATAANVCANEFGNARSEGSIPRGSKILFFAMIDSMPNEDVSQMREEEQRLRAMLIACSISSGYKVVHTLDEADYAILFDYGNFEYQGKCMNYLKLTAASPITMSKSYKLTACYCNTDENSVEFRDLQDNLSTGCLPHYYVSNLLLMGILFENDFLFRPQEHSWDTTENFMGLKKNTVRFLRDADYKYRNY